MRLFRQGRSLTAGSAVSNGVGGPCTASQPYGPSNLEGDASLSNNRLVTCYKGAVRSLRQGHRE